jgi:tRNA G18 (ribose-2'-O)-methylase SpoU
MIEHLTTVISLDDPQLQPYRTLKRPAEHQRQGIFVAEGEKVTRRLLESPIRTISILLTPQWLEVYRPVLVSHPDPIAVFVGEKPLLETIVGHNLHLGIMALGHIPKPSSIESVVHSAVRPFFFAAVEAITNAENMGVIVRNCAVSGAQALLVGETSADPYLRRSVRNSMGTVFKLPIVYCENLGESLRVLRTEFGIAVAAAHCSAENRSVETIDFLRDCCVVFGSEGAGLSGGVLAECDELFTIPMRDGVDSYNVGSASAIVFYEVMRQRRLSEK